MRSGVLLISSLIMFWFSCVVPLKTYATVVVKLSDEAMVNNAGTIITGTVTSIKSEWNEERTKIFTYVTILPLDFLKGEQNSQPIIIKQPGGQVGEIVMEVHGMSVFEESEEVFLFLKKGRKGFHRTVGLSQGKSAIETDPVTQRMILIKKKTRKIRTRDGKIQKEIMAIKSDKKIFLDDFRNRIQNILQLKNND